MCAVKTNWGGCWANSRRTSADERTRQNAAFPAPWSVKPRQDAPLRRAKNKGNWICPLRGAATVHTICPRSENQQPSFHCSAEQQTRENKFSSRSGERGTRVTCAAPRSCENAFCAAPRSEICVWTICCSAERAIKAEILKKCACFWHKKDPRGMLGSTRRRDGGEPAGGRLLRFQVGL